MQRLEQALVELSQRGEPIGPDWLLERVERTLGSEPDTVTIALDLNGTAVPIRERERESGRRRSRGPIFGAAVVAAAIALVVVALLPIGTETPPAAPPNELAPESRALVDDLVAALQARDVAAAEALVADDSLAFLEFMTALDTSGVQFFKCEDREFSLSCQTRLGRNHFFSRLGVEEPIPFTAKVVNRQLTDLRWPSSSGSESSVREAEAHFRAWAEEAHPELAAVMFDNSALGMVFSAENGQARMELIDEHLNSLVADLVTALRAGDVEAAQAVMADDPIWFFPPLPLEFITALDSSGVDFFDCEFGNIVLYGEATAAKVSCQTTLGPNNFFSRLVETGPIPFHARVVNGRLAPQSSGPGLGSWPFVQSHFEADEEFRAWVEKTHPELVDVMWSNVGPGFPFAWSAESGRTRMQLLDEYLASR